MNVTASFGWPLPRREPQPEPPSNRPDEFWWVETCEGMPLEPASISFQGDEPYGITEIGSDYEQPLSRRDVRLVERVVPSGRLAQVIPILEDVLSQQTAPVPDQQLFEAIALLQADA
ncbi:hypothetical protein FV222_02210 [Methylobacterium sp. WL103]|uniref:hypothetical protein n=1 Tax=Methylobacterium sp. WL103 TaxID=2603891 RepID=UPI0011CC2035|nr:hypothetical protein [Methylobacterium sp. WL103]TXN07498.1 hypothetical protein FV222_02210 [Methylobacterium sp. WL103]